MRRSEFVWRKKRRGRKSVWKARRKVGGEKRLNIPNVAYTVLGALHLGSGLILWAGEGHRLFRGKKVTCSVLVQCWEESL